MIWVVLTTRVANFDLGGIIILRKHGTNLED